MNIIMNGQTQNVSGKTSLRDLIAQFTKKPELVIAEVNGAIIPKAEWAATELQPNDQIELVSFVGGG